MKTSEGHSRARFKLRELNRIMACAASLMLTGVPAVVCESLLDEFYCSVRKSIERIKV
jgi:hypothetical protein